MSHVPSLDRVSDVHRQESHRTVDHAVGGALRRISHWAEVAPMHLHRYARDLRAARLGEEFRAYRDLTRPPFI